MAQILVKNIPDSQMGFFLELVQKLGFSSELKPEGNALTSEQKEFVDGVKMPWMK